MGQRFRTARLRRSALAAARRVGVEDHLKRLRAVADPGLRRDLRDHAAARVVIAMALPPDGDAVDVGAHDGDVLAVMARVAPEGRRLAYEPIPELHARLVAEFPQDDVRMAALSDETGTAEFVHVIDAPGFSGLRERSYPGDPARRRIEVRTERLDDALPEGFRPRLLKVDVEGAELQVLRGAAETLARERPVVLFEHGQGAAERYGEGSSAALHDLLVGHAGLRIFDLAGEGPFCRAQFEDLFTRPVWNFVAT